MGIQYPWMTQFEAAFSVKTTAISPSPPGYSSPWLWVSVRCARSSSSSHVRWDIAASHHIGLLHHDGILLHLRLGCLLVFHGASVLTILLVPGARLVLLNFYNLSVLIDLDLLFAVFELLFYAL